MSTTVEQCRAPSATTYSLQILIGTWYGQHKYVKSASCIKIAIKCRTQNWHVIHKLEEQKHKLEEQNHKKILPENHKPAFSVVFSEKHA